MMLRLLFPAFFLCGLVRLAAADASVAGVTQVPLVITGGHDTEPRDRGRPVVLVAAALGVPPAVFRDAFSHVKPAPAGERPDPVQVQANKRALLDRLAPYGVTNDRLDEVSNYYRYRRETGELWRHVDAAGYAEVRNGKLVTIVLTQHGAGYTNPPLVKIPGVGLTGYPLATLAFGTDLATNGSVVTVILSPLGDHEQNHPMGFPNDIQVQEIPSRSPPPPAPAPPPH